MKLRAKKDHHHKGQPKKAGEVFEESNEPDAKASIQKGDTESAEGAHAQAQGQQSPSGQTGQSQQTGSGQATSKKPE